jgi:hypothetical protein
MSGGYALTPPIHLHDKANITCQNYWVFGLFHRPVFYTLEDATFRKLDMFPFSGVCVGGGGEKTPNSVGSLRKS